jgi:hypothetical protein
MSSIPVTVTPQGVKQDEISRKRKQLKDEMNLDQFPHKYEVFLLLPSKMNKANFQIDENNLIT